MWFEVFTKKIKNYWPQWLLTSSYSIAWTPILALWNLLKQIYFRFIGQINYFIQKKHVSRLLKVIATDRKNLGARFYIPEISYYTTFWKYHYIFTRTLKVFFYLYLFLLWPSMLLQVWAIFFYKHLLKYIFLLMDIILIDIICDYLLNKQNRWIILFFVHKSRYICSILVIYPFYKLPWLFTIDGLYWWLDELDIVVAKAIINLRRKYYILKRRIRIFYYNTRFKMSNLWASRYRPYRLFIKKINIYYEYFKNIYKRINDGCWRFYYKYEYWLLFYHRPQLFFKLFLPSFFLMIGHLLQLGWIEVKYAFHPVQMKIYLIRILILFCKFILYIFTSLPYDIVRTLVHIHHFIVIKKIAFKRRIFLSMMEFYEKKFMYFINNKFMKFLDKINLFKQFEEDQKQFEDDEE